MAKRWYAVHTLSGLRAEGEKAALERIQQHDKEPCFGEVLVPSEKSRRAREDESEDVTRGSSTPGYILVNMELDNETWHLVKKTPKVTGFVGGANQPAPGARVRGRAHHVDAGRGRGAEAGDGLRSRRRGPVDGRSVRVDARRGRRSQRGARQAACRHQHVRSPRPDGASFHQGKLS